MSRQRGASGTVTRKLVCGLVSAAALIWTLPALAQPSWPTTWTPIGACAENAAPGDVTPERIDLVGSAGFPAAYLFVDSSYIYFRERVFGDPTAGGGFGNSSWVVLVKTASGDPFEYQYLISLDGTAELVKLYENDPVTAAPISFSPIFNDPADTELSTQPASTHARAVLADTSIGGQQNYFVDWAFPRSTLTTYGIDPNTSLYWFATSTNANNFNKATLDCPFSPTTTLSLSKSVTPTTVSTNQTSPVSYTLTVTNTGTYAAAGVTVSDSGFPSWLTITNVTSTAGTVSFSASSFQVQIASLGISASATITVTAGANPTAAASFTNTASAAATNAATATASSTLSAVAPTSTATRTATPSLTATATQTLTSTVTQTPTSTGTATSTASLTATPTWTPTPTPTSTPTASATASVTVTLTETATATLTSSATATPTQTETDTPTHSPVPTNTPTSTITLTFTPTDTLTPTLTLTPTATVTTTPTLTVTATVTATPTVTETPSATPSVTPTPNLCGNGIVDGVEACDDGNVLSGDGCEANCALSAACNFVHGGLPTERFVGACGAPGFATIQAAVSASSAGDVVSICPATYAESVVVDREVTIRSTAGPATTTIQSPGVAFDVQRSGVRIEGLTIEGATAAIRADAICPLGASSCSAPGRGSNVTITDNVIQNSPLGIAWSRKIDCIGITDNTLTDNAAHIVLDQQENPPAVLVTIRGNTLGGGGSSGHAVRLQNLGVALSVVQNTIDGAAQAGLIMGAVASGAQVQENNVRNNGTDGIIIKPGAAGTLITLNNIEDNGGLGLANEAPDAVLDARENWWGSQNGPLHAVDFLTGTGDEVRERLGGLDTLFIEFLCQPAPAGLPSVAGVCDTGGGGAEIDFIAPGESPDISSSGRFISFVSDLDQNRDARLGIDNADLGEEVFVLNRKPGARPNSFCIGGNQPNASCTKPSQCKGNLNLDPIVTDGDCILITQISHDATGLNSILAPRVNKRGDVYSTQTADLLGTNPDGSREVLRFTRKKFRRLPQSNIDPNDAIVGVSAGAAGIDSDSPAPSRNGRFIIIVSEGDFAGSNPDGNSELFLRDMLASAVTWAQITPDTAPPVQNLRPSTHSGKQVLFDSNGDLDTNTLDSVDNTDGNREIFLGRLRGTGWTFTQITDTAAPDENRAGQVARRGKVLVFTSTADLVSGENADGNSELFVWEGGVFVQITHTSDGENVNAHANPNGRFITFESTSPDLDPAAAVDNTATNRRVYYYDRSLNKTVLVSRSQFGDNFAPRLSIGRFIVWESTANLTGANAELDHAIYAYDRRRDD